jgi:alpha-glucoside transport system substrate-binding protein
MTRTFKYIAPLAVLMLVLAACDAGESAGPGASGDGELGGEISIIAVYADAEQDAFMSMLEPWADENGVQINYESTRDINAVLTTRLAGGNPPDIAGLPGPGQMAEFARNDQLVPLDDVIDLDTYTADYSEAWVDLGSVDDEFVGIFTKTSVKGPIWYNPAAFEDAGYDVPEDWDGLQALVEQIADDGTPPWGIGLEDSAASGWAGTDWIEDFLLRQSGPDAYNQWWQGELAWTSDEVRSAFEAFGAWAADPTYVAGGPNSVLNTAFGNGGDCMFDDPPECYLHHQASFITSFFEENQPDVAESGTTYDFFMFPEIEYNGVVAGGDLFGMFNDTPQARSLMQWLVTPEAQQIWVEIGGALSPNKGVSLDAYPDEISSRLAEGLVSAEEVVFDASDLMPTEMNAAFWSAVLDYVQNPDNLDSILENLDAVQEDSYGG